jgi:integrase
MPKIILTKKYIKEVTCPKDKPKWTVSDSHCKGLILEVRPSGGKTYYLKFRDERGTTRQIRLADAIDITLSQARFLADKARAKIALGENPLEQRRLFKSVPTFEEFIYEHYLPYIQTYKRSWKSDDCYLRCQILPAIGKKYLDEISMQVISDMHQGLKAKGYKPGTCNRSLVLVRYAFNLALRWNIPGVSTNPTKHLPLLDDPTGKRDRYLSKTEAHRLLDAVTQSDNPMLKHVIHMLLMTGARKREVLDAKWKDFDLEKRQWCIPINKLGRPRYVPISDGVLELLKNLPRDGQNPYVFPNPDTGKPYREIFKSWHTARKLAGLSDVRIHDLRHSFASFLVNSGRSLYEVQRILGHTQIKTTQRYAHLSQDTLLEAANVAVQLVA